MSSRGSRWLGETPPPERHLAALLSQLDRYRRILEQRMQLGTADLRILWLFADGRARTLKEVAHELRLEQSTVNRQVNAATTAGLLTRSRRKDSVAHEFLRTHEGAQAFESDLRLSLGAYASALGSLGAESADQFLSLMERFVSAYDDAVHSYPLDDTGNQ